MSLYGMGGGDAANFTDPFGLCPKSWGGDGKSGGLDDCPQGSSGAKEYAWLVKSSGAVADAGLADPYLWIGGIASGVQGMAVGATRSVVAARVSSIGLSKAETEAMRIFFTKGEIGELTTGALLKYRSAAVRALAPTGGKRVSEARIFEQTRRIKLIDEFLGRGK